MQKMSANLYEHAHELEKAVRKSPEFGRLRQMYETVADDAAARSLFDEFRNVQLQLQRKQVEGMPITDEEIRKVQKIAGRIQQNPKLVNLLKAEERMSTMIGELNQIMMKPIDELYGMVTG
jgi:cell fate (sporulation/competence/biofilm development) regulator YlbF (YheA/YmcA/DUF963 family)